VILIGQFTNRRNKHKERTPVLKYPYLSISEQLSALLKVPGMEETLEAWRKIPRVPGLKKDIFDGDVTKGLKGPDGKPFFANDEATPQAELRIGLNMGVDWPVFPSSILFFDTHIHVIQVLIHTISDISVALIVPDIILDMQPSA
jgi:hypothetical protein